MKYNLKRELPLILVVLLPLAAAILLYPKMPEQVPIHWNLHGVVDGYGSRVFGTFLLPLMNVALYVMFLVLPMIDPRRENYSKFNSSYIVIRYSLHLFLALMFGVTAAASLGYPLAVGKWIPAGVAVLFIAMGNIMSRVRHNYFVGFRYPWTLANEEVWKKTHQLGAKLMVAGGFAALAGILFTGDSVSFVILMAGVFIPIIITTIYSYIIYKSLSK